MAGARKRRGALRRIWSFAWKLTFAGVALTVLVTLALRWLAPPTSAFMIQHRLSGQSAVTHWWVPWEQISSYAPLAVIAAEDQKFPVHRGFDVQSIQDAVVEHINGEPLRGASTVSQQVAKNLFLWPEQSFVRKGIEAYFTVLIELLWPKQRILEVYLNIAEFGPGVYGLGAASELYFGKSAAGLWPEEAALLAAVLPNPKRLSVPRPSEYVRERQAWILAQMRGLGGVTYLQSLQGRIIRPGDAATSVAAWPAEAGPTRRRLRSRGSARASVRLRRSSCPCAAHSPRPDRGRSCRPRNSARRDAKNRSR